MLEIQSLNSSHIAIWSNFINWICIRKHICCALDVFRVFYYTAEWCYWISIRHTFQNNWNKYNIFFIRSILYRRFVCWNFRSQCHSKCIGLNLSGSFLSFFVVGLYFTFANYLCPLSSKSAKPNTQTNLLSEFGETNNFFFKALLKIVKTIWNFVGTIGISYSQHGLWRPMQWLRQE